MPPLTIAILGATGTFDPFLLQALATHPKAPEPSRCSKSTMLGLDTALDGVDVFLSAVGDDSGLTSKDVAHTGMLPGFKAQDAVAKAAKAAGVQLLVPSEYGSPTHTIALDSTQYVVGKRHPLEFLRSIDLPYLLVYPVLPTPLPASSATDPIPFPDPPFETTRYHVATYVVELLLDRCAEAVTGGIYVIRGLRRDRALVDEVTGKTKWVLDAQSSL
ncbi:hypothetical protein B0H14DRAFT_3096146 [Mycena olivaceomarginata]|nr:hypothetical protein B0H14DRAFT_3096146 [Mycena olivaceomarginata]